MVNWFKRLMEIKEEQLVYERRQIILQANIDETLTKLLREVNNGNKNRKRNS